MYSIYLKTPQPEAHHKTTFTCHRLSIDTYAQIKEASKPASNSAARLTAAVSTDLAVATEALTVA